MTTIKQSSIPKTHRKTLIFLNHYVTATFLYANPDTSMISILSCCETVRWDSSSQLTTTQHRWSNSSESTSRLAHTSQILFTHRNSKNIYFKMDIQQLQKLTLKLQIVLNTTSDGTDKTKETKAEGAQQQLTIQRTLTVHIQQKCKYVGK